MSESSFSYFVFFPKLRGGVGGLFERPVYISYAVEFELLLSYANVNVQQTAFDIYKCLVLKKYLQK